jgi:hypothetical protein
MQQAPSPGYAQGGYGQPSYGQPPYGASQAPLGGGGSFLGTAAAAAAGMVGGSLLLGSIRSMMGGSHYGFNDPTVVVENVASPSPWSDQSGGELARDAGINDIGSTDRADSDSRAGFFDNDQAVNDVSDDRDDMDLDSDNFGGDGDSDFA